jgi:hypothetical protein
MGPAVYMLGSVTTLLCGILLIRGYSRTGMKLLLWSGICFSILCLSNLLILVDLVLFPDVDLYLWRLGSAALAMMILLYGLIWEGE